MTYTEHWKTSPHANEFLPEEIERLEAGAMELCVECQWPCPVNGACGNCRTYRTNQDLDGLDDLSELPRALPQIKCKLCT